MQRYHPNRRAFLLGGTAAITAATPITALASRTVPDRRPNILLLLADDWSWPGSRAIDLTGARLPVFHRLGREGAMFENAFVASPTCTASRGAILTGRWPWRLEEGANLASVLPQHFPLYTDLLETNGYHVGFDGKGWAPGQLKPVGRTRNPAGRSFADFAAFLANRPDGTPFCFWHGAHEPHRPYQPGIGIRSGIDPASMVVPPYLEDTPATRSDMADYRYYAEAFDRQAGAILDALEKAGELDNTLVVMTGDNGWPFPRGKATLYDAGTHVPLAIRYPRRVPAGMIVRDPVSLVDLAATFLELGGVSSPIAMDSRSLLTLFGPRARPPRSYVLLGRERHMDGGSVPGQGYPSRALRTGTHLYIRNFRPDRYPAGIPGKLSVTANEIATDTYAAFADIDAGQAKRDLVLGDTDTARQVRALATGKRPARELYDVRNDPYQLRNLADDPSSAKLVARLDRFLMRDLARTGDPRIVEGADHDLFDHYPSYSDPGFGRPASLGQ